MLEIKNLSVYVGKKQILKNVNFTFEKGKIYAIMGPNGSGKSTLAASVMGHPTYSLGKGSSIKYKGKEITKLKVEERAKMGLFMSFQSPLSLNGVNIYQLLRFALDKKKDPLKIRQETQKNAKKLKIDERLLTRGLNENFSGGEKKKMEVLQAAALDPDLIFFDEIDTGVDVDAMRTIATFLKGMKSKNKTFVLITHYNRILKYIKPDHVLILVGGKLVKTGTYKLADKIEKEGYATTSA